VERDELFQTVLFLEFFDPAFRIDDLLLPCIEGVATGTDLDLQVLLGRAGFNHIPAGTGYGGNFVFWMYLVLHGINPFSIKNLELVIIAFQGKNARRKFPHPSPQK
jgi:hypothetical protein